MTATDKRTLVIVIIIFLVVMTAVFWDYVSYAAHKAKDIASGNSDGSKIQDPIDTLGNAAAQTVTPIPAGWNAVLKKGVYDSPEVRQLQKLLNQVQTWNTVAEDGDFGPATEKKLLSVTGKKEITMQQAYAMLQKLFQ